MDLRSALVTNEVLTQAPDKTAEEPLAALAEKVLGFFQSVSDSARAMLGDARPKGHSSLVVEQSWMAGKTLQNLNQLDESKRHSLRQQIAEPAIAKVVVVDEDGVQQEIFIARTTPYASGGATAASYRSPMGRLASIAIGSEQEVYVGGRLKSFEVLERAVLRPKEDKLGWDSISSVLDRLGTKPVTVNSLRILLKAMDEQEDVLEALDALFREQRVANNVVEGLRRSVVQKMALRDQPLLDAFQDEIFRLPLRERVVLLGPPGSGKTTTLIKRLGLKLDSEYLNDEERAMVERSRAGLTGHAKSWLMFTPTELLKQYVKEAFGREGLPASEITMKTWSDYRRDLARNTFRILRTSSGAGLLLRPGLRSLLPGTSLNTISWYEDFAAWQRQSYWSELKAAADILISAQEQSVQRLGANINRVLDAVPGQTGATPFLALERASIELDQLLTTLSQDLKERLRKLLWVHIRSRTAMLTELAVFIDGLDSVAEEEIDDSEGEDDDDDQVPLRRDDLEQAYEAYSRAISADARASAQGRRLGRGSRAGRILEWLGDRVLPTQDRAVIGKALMVQAAMRRLRNPIRTYVSRIPARYRRFRSARRAEGVWYQSQGYMPTEVGPLEVDIILLTTLRAANALLADRSLAARAEDETLLPLTSVRNLWCNQVVVDEATDFSPIQLACMAELVDPATRGFVACGDFNQRVTAWGTRSEQELRWVLADMMLRPVTITYRHSRQLNELAHAIAVLSGDESTAARLPPDVDSDGVAPVVGLSLEADNEVDWLVERIVEIERFTQELPSVAVLVATEAEVAPLAALLDDALMDRNIRAVSCPDGKVVGQDSDVRVFCVEHIKGLEFEAVFFVAIDKLAMEYPNSFDKHLYVGATRAAMYLGVTCTTAELPEALAPLSDTFASNWR